MINSQQTQKLQILSNRQWQPWLLVIFLVLISCQSPQKSTPREPPKAVSPRKDKSDPNLTQDYAAFRADVLRDATYDLKIDATAASEFSGSILITFELNQKLLKPLLLDFRADGTVQSLKINHQAIGDIAFSESKIALAADLLKIGSNSVEVSFRRSYSTDGNGLYRFVDPEDDRVYLWTQFEPYAANSMFPCFDQPDLKASFKFEAKVPNHWEVVSTTRQSQVLSTGKTGEKLWRFPATVPISTYLFSFFTGPYFHWDSEAKSDLGRVPIRLFVRQSLKKYVHAEDWFSVTRDGLKYYGHLFGYPYPFTKYDQLIVPDFNEGGMENVASVALSEEYVFRGLTADIDREKIADMVLHEMAHMWFGDLVTMKWWNGLWLNESFASYMSAKASVEATEFKGAWLTFHDEMKDWAYFEDQLVTTHAIDSEVIDTKVAANAFDGITYGKGASALQQLNAYIGEAAFTKGIKSYFKNHAFQNARLTDFISELGRASGKDLGPWAQAWLKNSGLDHLQASLSCEKGKITNLHLTLTSPQDTVVKRPHFSTMGLFTKKNQKVVLGKTFSVELNNGPSSEVSTVSEAIGLNCPDFILANSNDRDYVKIEFDRASIDFMSQHINSFTDPLVRTMLWHRLFEMVIEGEFSAKEFVQLAAKGIDRETDKHVIYAMLRALNAAGREGSAFYYLSRKGDQLAKSVASIERVLWKKLITAEPQSEWQGIYLDGFIASAYTAEAQKELREILAGRHGLKAPLVDQDWRWLIIVRLMSLNAEGAPQLLEAEKKRDASERGQQMALAAAAAQPDVTAKLKILQGLAKDDDSSSARKEAVLRNILPPWQDALRASYAEQFFAAVTQMSSSEDQQFTDRYVHNLMPATCQRQGSDAIEGYLQKHRASLGPIVVKSFRVSLQQDRRCVTVREKSDKEP